MRDLQRWLDKEGLSPAALQGMLGLKSRSSVYRYLNGTRKPKGKVVKKLTKLSNGIVTANSFT